MQQVTWLEWMRMSFLVYFSFISLRRPSPVTEKHFDTRRQIAYVFCKSLPDCDSNECSLRFHWLRPITRAWFSHMLSRAPQPRAERLTCPGRALSTHAVPASRRACLSCLQQYEECPTSFLSWAPSHVRDDISVSVDGWCPLSHALPLQAAATDIYLLRAQPCMILLRIGMDCFKVALFIKEFRYMLIDAWMP